MRFRDIRGQVFKKGAVGDLRDQVAALLYKSCITITIIIILLLLVPAVV